MIGESFAASNAPSVSVSAFNASSGGHSSARRSWDNRPFDTESLALRSVSVMAPGALRYSSNILLSGLDHLNPSWQEESLARRNAFHNGGGYHRPMAVPHHDWYLKEWLASFEPKKKQSDIVNDLGWNKAKVSLMVRGIQPYTRDEINELADYLNIKPHELLMHPEDAHAARRLRADMLRLAHEAETDGPLKKVSTN
jgi:hypothetical protein